MASKPQISHSRPLRLLRGVALGLLAAGLISMGCKSSSPTGPTPMGNWQEHSLWPHGTHPVASPVGDAVLFLQEETPAGFCLLRGGVATMLEDSSFGVRADYAWSPDGNSFAFSSPGTANVGETGIWQGTLAQPQLLTKLVGWGSHPRYLPNGEGIVFGGPEDGGAYEGLWQVRLNGSAPESLATQGVNPEISPDGLSIAFLVPGGISGRTIVILNRETGAKDTVAGRAWTITWLGDSRTIIFDTETEPFGAAYRLRYVDAPSHVQGEFGVGTLPAGIPSTTDFVFTAIANDQLDGLFAASLGGVATRISDIGTQAFAANSRRIVAQDTIGLIELTR